MGIYFRVMGASITIRVNDNIKVKWKCDKLKLDKVILFLHKLYSEFRETGGNKIF